MLKKKMLAAALGVALIGITGSGAALAADGAALYVQKTCSACHGPDAKTPIMPIYPKLAGQGADYALAQMKDIKSGKRNNGQSIAMKAIMAMVSDDEMATIAKWLSTLK